jgi:hypothetical protein
MSPAACGSPLVGVILNLGADRVSEIGGSSRLGVPELVIDYRPSLRL